MKCMARALGGEQEQYAIAATWAIEGFEILAAMNGTIEPGLADEAIALARETRAVLMEDGGRYER